MVTIIAVGFGNSGTHRCFYVIPLPCFYCKKEKLTAKTLEIYRKISIFAYSKKLQI